MVEIYLVGGAVRDKLLHLVPTEKDWLVVGATANILLAQGYRCVGKDFPVYLHPKTQEEYALARTERKVAPGYGGFEFTANQHVTVEQDLSRRDLTINAIAEDEQGQLVDPYHGVTDINNKVLRHVSPAFAEDPVRILRVARFAARFAHLGFVIAEETLQLMRKMVEAKEVDALVSERVWKETHKALQEKTPARYFQVLQECAALPILFAAINCHYQRVLEQLVLASNANTSPLIRFAAMLLPLDIDEIKTLCQHNAVPNEYKNLALLLRNHLTTIKTADSAEAILQLLNQLDVFRRPERLSLFIDVMTAVGEQAESVDLLAAAYAAAKMVSVESLIAKGYAGKQLGEKIQQQRLQCVEKIIV